MDQLQRQGLCILQKREGFRFGTDAVLLAAFAGIRKREWVVDLGTGTGILPLLLYGREPTARFEAVELLPEMADMAARSIALNGLQAAISVHAMDLRNAPQRLGYGRFDLVVCNPPYGKANAALANPNPAKAAARHDHNAPIGEIARVSAALLRNGGRAAFIFPAQRLLELTGAMEKVFLEPKRIQLVHPAPGKAPCLVLLEGVRSGGRQLHWQPPLFLADEHGQTTPELDALYNHEKNLSS